MTTKVTVHAHAGWPVKVIPVDPKTGNWLPNVTIVPPHDTRDFFVHDGQDLIIHEGPPDEPKDAGA